MLLGSILQGDRLVSSFSFARLFSYFLKLSSCLLSALPHAFLSPANRNPKAKKRQRQLR